MKKNIAQTSIIAHQENKVSGLYLTQEQKAISILLQKGEPMTAREVMNKMRPLKWIELSSVHRTINTLIKNEQVKIVGTCKCSFSKRRVRIYFLKDQNYKRTACQGTLF